MDVTMLLCDHAEEVSGKLYLLGGGWNILFTSGAPANIGVAVLIEVPWDQTNRRHWMRAELLTSDGPPVEIEGQPVVIQTEFELGRPAGVKPGSSLNAPFAINVNGLLLQAGGYEWKLLIDDEPLARRAFTVAHPPAGFGPPR